MRYIYNRSITKEKKIVETNNLCEGKILDEYLLEKCRFNTSAILFKRTCIEMLGGFDVCFKRHQDYELMIRFFRDYEILCTGEDILTIYDCTSERINVPNVADMIDLEHKFIETFSLDFKRMPKGNSVCFHIWENVLAMALLYRQYSYVGVVLGNMHVYAKKISEVIFVLKYFLLGVLTRK